MPRLWVASGGRTRGWVVPTIFFALAATGPPMSAPRAGGGGFAAWGIFVGGLPPFLSPHPLPLLHSLLIRDFKGHGEGEIVACLPTWVLFSRRRCRLWVASGGPRGWVVPTVFFALSATACGRRQSGVCGFAGDGIFVRRCKRSHQIEISLGTEICSLLHSTCYFMLHSLPSPKAQILKSFMKKVLGNLLTLSISVVGLVGSITLWGIATGWDYEPMILG